MNDATQTARLRFLCRRGMKELDSILEPFFDTYYSQLTPSVQDQFAALVLVEEPQLWDWLVLKQTTEVPEDLKTIVDYIIRVT